MRIADRGEMTSILLFALIASLGVFVQSFAGFAGSLVAVPLFSLFLSPKEAVPAHNTVMLIMNLWLVWETRGHIRWERVIKLMVGGLIGVPIGVLGLKHLPVHIIGTTISVVTLTFAILFLLKVRVHLTESGTTQFGVGLLSGFLGGSISESGPPVVIYALSRDWDKNAFRSSLLAYFTCLALEANACYWMQGMMTTRAISFFSCAILPAFLASFIGLRLKNVVGESTFRRVILFIVIGVSIIGLARHTM